MIGAALAMGSCQRCGGTTWRSLKDDPPKDLAKTYLLRANGVGEPPVIGLMWVNPRGTIIVEANDASTAGYSSVEAMWSDWDEYCEVPS